MTDEEEYEKAILQDGSITKVSKQDAYLLKRYSWTKSKDGYAVARINGKYCRLHRLIVPDHDLVDHINNDRLDNRRSNLRPANHHQNAANRKKREGLTSKYSGVSFSTAKNKWYAQIEIKGKKYALGYFTTEEEAAIVYNERAKEAFGEFAKLNEVKKDAD